MTHTLKVRFLSNTTYSVNMQYVTVWHGLNLCVGGVAAEGQGRIYIWVRGAVATFL